MRSWGQKKKRIRAPVEYLVHGSGVWIFSSASYQVSFGQKIEEKIGIELRECFSIYERRGRKEVLKTGSAGMVVVKEIFLFFPGAIIV